jgi:hypothetical protein
MRKPPSTKHQAVKQLKVCIRESRKIARQINRKLESLAQWNKMVQQAKNKLVELCGLK